MLQSHSAEPRGSWGLRQEADEVGREEPPGFLPRLSLSSSASVFSLQKSYLDKE